MYNFLLVVFFEIIFQILDYFWSALGDYAKEGGLWKDCPKDIDFWHSVHGMLVSINLSIILIILGRLRSMQLNYKFLLKISIVLQLFSLYWLIQGIIWIEVDIETTPDCVTST
jgi:hypothetical protein